MRFLRLLSCVSLIFTTAMAVCVTENSGDGSTTDFLPYSIIPTHYDIKLMPDLVNTEHNVSFHGESNVNIRIRCATHEIRVHTMEMKINESETTLMGDNGAIYKPANHIYDNYTDTALLTFDDELSRGPYILYVKFIGRSLINEKYNLHRTLYTSKKGGRIWTAMMPFMPITIYKKDFPCWGKPPLIHTFNISVRHPATFRAFSGTPIRVQSTDGNGMIWTHFDITPFISSCFVAVMVTDFVHVSNNPNETVNMWCRSHLISQMKFAQSVAKKVTEHLGKYTNISKEISKIDHVAIPHFSFRGVTFSGLTFYTESEVIYDDTTDPLYRRRNVAKLIAHETTHQWFGGLITPSSLSHMWLSEGFASYFQTYILDKIFENWHMIDFFVIDKLHDFLSYDIDSSIECMDAKQPFNISNIKILTFSYMYDKVPIILRMLQHIITEEVFQDGIITFLNMFKFDSVTPDDLWNVMQIVLNKSSVPHKNFKIKEVMDTWMNQTHYPIVNVMRNYETGETIISQEHFHSKTNNNTSHKWWIPVTLTTQTNPDFSNISIYWLTPLNKSIRLEIHPNDWVIVNLQQIGCYRVNYDIINWQKIANYLNSNEYTKIHVLNRAQIIDDSYALMMNSHVAQTLDKLFKSTGCEENPEENDIIKLRRVKVAKWACLLGNLECKKMATVKLSNHLADPETNKIPSWWQRWTYCSGSMIADKATWNRLLNLYMQKRNKDLLEFLACSENSDIIIDYLNIISSENSTLQDKEHNLAFQFIVIKHSCNNAVLDYILENFERVKPKLMNRHTVLKNIISNIYTTEQLDKVKEYWKNNLKEISNIPNAIQASIDSRINNLKNLLNDFSARFKNMKK
ncbi:aminopeptidase N-like [Pogonomyrmex barbatus]|uniref:Aminopeptidase n=1 Tax=Pogonomyrmex barbatus TaxID=144034 RepID=A0A6I9VSP3_9HYME|nr:aminopeptidase N-like [Pogonomyrmex barbatus]